MKILTFSTLYPSAARPSFGIFVENRLRHLITTQDVESRVVAPVPWFPLTAERFGDYARFAKTPDHEIRHGLDVLHPRYITLPRLGLYVQPWTLYWAIKPVLTKIIRDGFDFDVIDAHYFYPDGVAAVWLGKALGKPVVITSRGTDLTYIPSYPWARKLIRKTIHDADGLITVSKALADILISLGAPPAKPRVLRNGVDLVTFTPKDRSEIRHRFGLTGPTILSVGNLVPGKAHDLTLQAVAQLPDVTFLLAGRGPEDSSLKALAERLGITNRVRFLGSVPHDQLVDYYNAADILVHSSAREGMANVLLEALACGTPIVGSPIPGMDEIVNCPEAGLIMADRTPEACADAIRQMFASLPDRTVTRQYATTLSWTATSEGQMQLFKDIVAARAIASR